MHYICNVNICQNIIQDTGSQFFSVQVPNRNSATCCMPQIFGSSAHVPEKLLFTFVTSHSHCEHCSWWLVGVGLHTADTDTRMSLFTSSLCLALDFICSSVLKPRSHLQVVTKTNQHYMLLTFGCQESELINDLQHTADVSVAISGYVRNTSHISHLSHTISFQQFCTPGWEPLNVRPSVNRMTYLPAASQHAAHQSTVLQRSFDYKRRK